MIKVHSYYVTPNKTNAGAFWVIKRFNSKIILTD